MSDEKKDTKFKKGQSGNPRGRPKGRTVTDGELKRTLAKGDQVALDTIMNIMTDEDGKDLNLKFRAANQWLNFSFQIRASELKKRLAAKSKAPDDRPHEFDEEDVNPVVSIVAV